MGNEGANLAGMQQAPDRLEDVVRGITGKVWLTLLTYVLFLKFLALLNLRFIQQIDGATRESIGGTFASFDGAKVEW